MLTNAIHHTLFLIHVLRYVFIWGGMGTLSGCWGVGSGSLSSGCCGIGSGVVWVHTKNKIYIET